MLADYSSSHKLSYYATLPRRFYGARCSAIVLNFGVFDVSAV
ncbi:hypothetical protein HMPREF1581_01198 [Gardnerella vaginalis JCP8108]|uniref:Uncharacterized protein n=1 Tax=Gardnerella vaginalis JCP8108 TaxID=1261066 RepID=S4GNQ8_GARVA|nr:hypothetical protein HMPREF1581_01198 [Gardnerella vaginalis JCP8108]